MLFVLFQGRLLGLRYRVLCSVMFVIEALHPDGWRRQGRHDVEYWAYQEAQTRCCSDGRNYRILNGASGQLVALIHPSSCRQAALAPQSRL